MTFFIGGPVNDDDDRIPDAQTKYDPSDLTTHGVIVGMTGSGKTGLGVIYLEEALRNNIPTLVIDPKGDMTNLLLTFPDLAPEDFEPWIDAAAAAKEDRTPLQEAADEATKWSNGLASWGLAGDDIGSMRASIDMAIYTPGSDAGIPLNVIGNLDVPDLSWDTESEAMRDEIQGFVSGLLGLVDVDADPISSREHILLSNLVEHSWRKEVGVDIATLISQIVTPPIRKLGVFDVDTFFPEKDRMALAMKLNGLLASPSFASWMEGEPLDVESLLWKEGKPQASIIYIAHLEETERQFIVTMLLSKLITWMRSQPGSSDLRALIYMDEVFGFVPPTAEPPSKKPILTILKQARAFGVGLLLSTQNPVDLDYKAMSNAGTWCIGRLQTERDKARIMEALSSASGDIDTARLSKQISGLGKRVFLLHNTREKAPEIFTTRWAMSYLRGPMTREEIGSVTVRPTAPQTSAGTPTPQGATVESSRPTEQQSTLEPEIAEGIESGALHPAAAWVDDVGYAADGDHYEAAIALTVALRFDEARVGIDQDETWEAILHPVSTEFDAGNLTEVDHDPRDFVEVDTELPFATPDAPLSQSSYFRSLESDLKKHLDRDETITVYRNRSLKTVSRPGESTDEFGNRLATLAQESADAETAKLRDKYEARYRTAKRAYDDAFRTADSAQRELDDARGSALLGLGLDLLSGRRPKVSGSTQRSAENRLRKAGDKIEAKRREIEDLNADLEDEVRAIRRKWDEAASQVDEIEIGLESDDIDVRDIRVVWIRK
ncbi:MAG: ATP-binding protein [Acidimicrobiia bacterium]